MKLTVGKCYRLADGTVVKVVANGANVDAINVAGTRVHTQDKDKHVNGWTPCSKTEFEKEAKPVAKKKAIKKKVAKKKRKVIKKKR